VGGSMSAWNGTWNKIFGPADLRPNPPPFGAYRVHTVRSAHRSAARKLSTNSNGMCVNAIALSGVRERTAVCICLPLSDVRAKKAARETKMNEAEKLPPALVAEHGLKPEEYERILKLIGRTPSFTELGIFSAMWNEHCSYKSSKVHLRTLPTSGPQVIQGPGENAGVIDIGDGPRRGVSRWRATTTRAISNPIRVPRPGSAEFMRDVFTMGGAADRVSQRF